MAAKQFEIVTLAGEAIHHVNRSLDDYLAGRGGQPGAEWRYLDHDSQCVRLIGPVCPGQPRNGEQIGTFPRRNGGATFAKTGEPT